VETRQLTRLRPHPRNVRIYGDGADQDLVESVSAHGVLEPLLITRDGLVVSGHRRLDAACKSNRDSVPVSVLDTTDDTELLDVLLQANKQRVKTNVQIGREYEASLEVEHERAARRQARQALLNQPQNQNGQKVLNSTPSDNGKARDLAAERIGVGWQKAERAAAVVQASDRLEDEGKTREASQLRTTLNSKSVSRAYSEAQEQGYLPKVETVVPNYGRVITLDNWAGLSADEQQTALQIRDPKFKFNSQATDNIEWAYHSWNPVTGCKHDCSYCYARDIAVRRYPHGFAPALLPGRLSAAANTAVPSEAAHNIGYKNVFTCSMADLFGKWVPTEWIQAVLNEVTANPQWNFLFLTKFPLRYAEFAFPVNAWIGTSVDAQARIPNAEKAFARVHGGVKWLSCEPMLERLTFTRLDLFDWVVIGGASRSTQTPEFRPPRAWVEHLEAQAAAAGCKVYEKTNLLERKRDYPGQNPPPGVVVPDAFKMGYLQRDVAPADLGSEGSRHGHDQIIRDDVHV
jgi:protein gp37/ParB-like chromosome segregation protein Spo0J